MQRIIKLLMLSLIFFSVLNACALIKEQAKEAVVKESSEIVAKRLPEEKREEFLEKFSASPEEGIKFAAETIGIEKLAAALEEKDAENKRLADELRAGGVETARMKWFAIISAFVGGGGSLLGVSKRNKWVRVVRAVIDGVKTYTNEAEDSAVLKSAIKVSANKAGVKTVLDREVAKAA